MTLLADMNVAFDPALPALGWPLLLQLSILLAVLTIWTYFGVRAATFRRVAMIVALRLSALSLAFAMLMRPSFATTELEGVETTKFLVIADASKSMNVAEVEGKPTRWEHVNKIWTSPDVQRRIERLRAEQKIEVVKYLGAEDLRADDPNAAADGKRTDIGVWLHQLMQKHGHEKHLRGIVLISDGADNGTKFSAQEKARAWRGVAPIHAFGVGDPANPKYRKDIGLTSLKVEPVPPEPIFIRSPMTVKAIAQAPGFEKAEVEVSVWVEHVEDKTLIKIADKKLTIRQEKDQPILVKCDAPEKAGEYKLTLKIAPHPEEANDKNNEISTFIQVSKEKIKVLWVDRPRAWEPKLAIDLALKPEKQFEVHFVVPPSDGKGDPFKELDLNQHWDVIVIGDISAQQFSFGNPKIFDRIRELVTKDKTGLLMLGGSETFVKGGWDKQKAILGLLPVALDVPPDKAEFIDIEVRAFPTKEGKNQPFTQFDPDLEKNKVIWEKKFYKLAGSTPVGTLLGDAFLRGEKDEILMAGKLAGIGRVVVFAVDSTESSWRTPETMGAYKHFWKQLVFWLAQQQDRSNQLWVNLDRRRLDANAAEVLGFEFGLRGKSGKELPSATFTAKIVTPSKQEIAVTFGRRDQHQQGTFQGAKEPGEHRLIVTATAKEDGKSIELKKEAHFLVAFDDIEMLRPLAEHETLSRIAASAEGRFQVLEEVAFVQYLDELKSQVNRESRHKTTHWPDWKRLPASDGMRDQLAGLWHSFALVSLVVFVALVGGEWLLRRLWGLV